MIKVIKAKDRDFFLLVQEQSETEMLDWGQQKKPESRLQNECDWTVSCSQKNKKNPNLLPGLYQKLP